MAAGSGKKVYFDNLSLRELVAPFGPSWRGGVADAGAGSEFSYLDFPVPDVALVHTATGGEISFAKTTSGGFFPEPGAESFTLAYNSGGNYYDLADIDGTVVRFTNTGTATPYTATSTWTTAASSTTTMNILGRQGLHNRAGSFVRVGWSVVGAKKFIGVNAARSVFRVAVGNKHLDLFYGPWAPWR